MSPATQINKNNLKQICGLNGIPTVVALSRRIKRSRNSIYRSLEKPNTFPLTYRRILRALPRRTISRN